MCGTTRRLAGRPQAFKEEEERGPHRGTTTGTAGQGGEAAGGGGMLNITTQALNPQQLKERLAVKYQELDVRPRGRGGVRGR